MPLVKKFDGSRVGHRRDPIPLVIGRFATNASPDLGVNGEKIQRVLVNDALAAVTARVHAKLYADRPPSVWARMRRWLQSL